MESASSNYCDDLLTLESWLIDQRAIEWSDEWNPDLGIHQPNQWMEGQSTQMGPPPGSTTGHNFFSTWVHPVLFLFVFQL